MISISLTRALGIELGTAKSLCRLYLVSRRAVPGFHLYERCCHIQYSSLQPLFHDQQSRYIAAGICPSSRCVTLPLISAFSSSAVAYKPWHITMDEDEKKKKWAEIEKMKKEKKPKGLFAKIKYYCKRYWYIAIPVHAACSLLWFGALFAAIESGVDVISFLESIHAPEYLIEKVKNTPPGAGVAVLALILFKIASPLRYATTIAGIQVAFWTLRRLGKLKTAKEVEYKMRTVYERGMIRLRRRSYIKFSRSRVRAVKKRPLNNVEKKSS